MSNMTQKPYFQSVHLLRGVAALLVVCDHLLGPARFFTWLDGVGDWGVVCFFVISGFAIAHSLGSEYEVGGFARFMARRLVRIEPTYLVSIAIQCAFLMALTRIAPRAVPWSPTEEQLLSHLFYLVPFTGGEWLVPAYWSLAVEFQFYLAMGLLYPALLLAERRSPDGIFPCAILFATLAILSSVGAGAGLLEYAPFFAIGVLLARQLAKPKNPLLLWGAVLIICAVAFLAGSGSGKSAACAGLITFAIVYFWPPDFRVAGRLARVGFFLGTISYSWYVIHTTVGMAGDYGARLLLKFDAFPLQQQLADLVPVACFSASILAAWLLYVAIERPTHLWARRIALRADRRA